MLHNYITMHGAKKTLRKTVIVSNSALLKLNVNHFKVHLGRLYFNYTNRRDKPLEPVNTLTQSL
jgi:hypothetical protein